VDSFRDLMREINDLALMCDDLDDCVVGYLEQFGRPAVVLYDKQKVIKRLVKDGMSEDEASEYFYFNIVGAGAGDNTPAFMSRFR
jgi:hypothetical protein